MEPNQNAMDLKKELLSRISDLRSFQKEDGEPSIDFGVKGGELNNRTRAPQKVDFYSVSERVGAMADEILSICQRLAENSPCKEPTKYLGDPEQGELAPLDGPWKLLFSTAADATFSSNSTRGAAKAQNIVDGSRGRITNVIDFVTREDGTEPALKQLNVVIKASAVNQTRVELQFKYAKAVLTKFFFFPLFGRRLNLYIPVPGPFITRCIVFLNRLLRRKVVKKVPKAYFDILYLDGQLRVHRTGEDNYFIQARESWKDAQPLLG